MSSIQFNLLPDVKETYINTQRNRKTVITICVLASIISVALLVLVFFSVDVVQKAQLSKADSDSKKAQTDLLNVNGLTKVLTIQNQLKTLASLHQSTHAAGRLFTFMPQLTPAAASIGSLSADFSANTLTVSGTADTQATINAFVDTLKFAVYRSGDQDSEHPAFSSVTLTSFDITPGKASYSINAVFDPALFANPLQASPTVSVKNQVTTRSVLDDPANLFNGQTTAKPGNTK